MARDMRLSSTCEALELDSSTSSAVTATPPGITSGAPPTLTIGSRGTTPVPAATRGITVRGRSSCRWSSPTNPAPRGSSGISRQAPAARLPRGTSARRSSRNCRPTCPSKSLRLRVSQLPRILFIEQQTLSRCCPEFARGHWRPAEFHAFLLSIVHRRAVDWDSRLDGRDRTGAPD